MTPAPGEDTGADHKRRVFVMGKQFPLRLIQPYA